MGTFMTRLTLFAPVGPFPDTEEPARHVPTINWYENFNERPLNVGGKLFGRGKLYVSVGSAAELDVSGDPDVKQKVDEPRTGTGFSRTKG
jgi:hypothetical protein